MFSQLLKELFCRSFSGRMSQIARELGWLPLQSGRLWSDFQMIHEGQIYFLRIDECGSRVQLTLMSNGYFAPGLYPPILKCLLLRRNEQLEELTWRLSDGHRASQAQLICTISVRDWNAKSTNEMVSKMLIEVHRYDAGLCTHGLM
jgi:hypothetical protein